MNAKEGPHNTNMHIALIFRKPTKTSRCTLVTRLDEIIGKLFDRRCRVPCDHWVYVMANEDSLFGFDNDNAVSALLEISISKRTLDK